jgi:hypothetical protein
MRTQTLDDSTKASDPGRIDISHIKMSQFHPELYQQGDLNSPSKYSATEQRFWNTHHAEHLLCGDSRAAMVASIEPLLVAAYTDELDCIAMLRFPDDLVREYELNIYQKLLTVNLYRYGQTVADLENGPASYHRYGNFTPFIAEFLSDDRMQIEHRKTQILEAEWRRTQRLARIYIAKHGETRVRDGRPMYCDRPAIGN